MTQIELIELLDAFAIRSGITQENMAHEIGITYPTLNAWFNGRHTKMHKATEDKVRLFLKARGELK